MKTDDELKQLLAKMLPEQIVWVIDGLFYTSEESQEVSGIQLEGFILQIKDSELLHVCWLIEQTLNATETVNYRETLSDIIDDPTRNGDAISASWQHRTMALAQVKGLLC